MATTRRSFFQFLMALIGIAPLFKRLDQSPRLDAYDQDQKRWTPVPTGLWKRDASGQVHFLREVQPGESVHLG